MPPPTILVCPDHLPADEILKYRHRVFLAGGIFGCPDWQSMVIKELQVHDWEEYDLLIMNPRRPKFEKTDEMLKEQVAWEYQHLNQFTNLSWFWFPMETLCPITLYELGRATNQNKPFFVGFHPGYQRSQTMIEQLKYARPDAVFSQNLMELTMMFRYFVESKVLDRLDAE